MTITTELISNDPPTSPLAPPAGRGFHLSFQKSTTASTTRIGTKFGMDVHCAQVMHPADFGDRLISPLAPPRG